MLALAILGRPTSASSLSGRRPPSKTPSPGLRIRIGIRSRVHTGIIGFPSILVIEAANVNIRMNRSFADSAAAMGAHSSLRKSKTSFKKSGVFTGSSSDPLHRCFAEARSSEEAEVPEVQEERPHPSSQDKRKQVANFPP